MHPVALWYQRVCQLQTAHIAKPGDVYSAPETGAARAYLELAYNLYLLEHNAELRAVLLRRLKDPKQFLGALSEIRVAGMLVRAGFSVQFHDESDSNTTHCEYDAKRAVSGGRLSVEVKTRHWDVFPTNDDNGRRQVQISVGRLLRDALAKEAVYDRVIIIELAMPHESLPDKLAVEPWWVQPAKNGVRETEERLTQLGRIVPPARVIVCNHPYHLHLDSTDSVVGYSLDGIGPTDFRGGLKGTVREAIRFREKHADMMALWSSIKEHQQIPQTFNGQSHHLAFGNHPPRLIVGHAYCVPDQSGAMVNAILEDAVVVPSEQAAYGIYRTDVGQRIVCMDTLTEPESRAYAEQPDTFFGVMKRQTPINDPLELYDFFFDSYGKSTKDALFGLMSNRPDIESLRSLPQSELSAIYCEGLVHGVLGHIGWPR